MARLDLVRKPPPPFCIDLGYFWFTNRSAFCPPLAPLSKTLPPPPPFPRGISLVSRDLILIRTAALSSMECPWGEVATIGRDVRHMGPSPQGYGLGCGYVCDGTGRRRPGKMLPGSSGGQQVVHGGWSCGIPPI